jgi:hypothetical protein
MSNLNVTIMETNDLIIELKENNLDVEIDINKVDSPALQRILKEFSDPEIVTKMYDKHSDWGQQGQCGCVMGCLGG